MPPLPRVNPLDPLASLGPSRRLGQGVPGGRAAVGRNLINPLNPASSLPRLDPIQIKRRRIDDSISRLRQDEAITDLVSRSRYRQTFSGAGQRVSDPNQRDFNPQERQELRLHGVDEADMAILRDILRQKEKWGTGRHHSTLTNISRTLGAIEAAGAGFVRGAETYQEKHGLEKDPLKYVKSPAHIYREVKAGISEMPDAVTEGYTYGDLIRESTNPNSLMHKWAMPVGLGIAILADPTTYLSFGATSVSKTAAYHALAAADARVAPEAARLVSGHFGETIKVGGWRGKATWDNIDTISQQLKIQRGMPISLGDALNDLKKAGLANKAQIRQTGKTLDPVSGELVKATKRQKAGAHLLPRNVKGGRGTRLGGIEIPGTPRLGEWMAGTTRTAREGSKAADAMGEMVIPDWATRHIADDAARASAMVEVNRFKSNLQKAKSDIAVSTRALQRPFVPAAGRFVSREGEDELGIPLMDFMLPTVDEIQTNPWKGNFPVMHDPVSKETISGLYGFGHEHLIDGLAINGRELDVPKFHQGRAIIDPETGQIAKINWSEEADRVIPQSAKDEALRSVRRKWYDRDELLNSISYTDDGAGERVLVRPDERRGIMEVGDTTKLTPAQLAMRRNIETVSGEYIKKATNVGMSEKAMTKLWDDLVDFYDDPLLALAEFKFKSTARVLAKTFLDETLKDRRFALPMADDLEKAGKHDITKAPNGYTAYKHGAKTYAVRNSIIDAVKDLGQPSRLDTNLQRGFRLLNIPQDWWKLYATSPNPAFHVMNFLGATWNNALAGVYNPADYYDAMKTLYRGRKEEAAQAGAKFGMVPGMRKVPETSQTGREAQSVLQEAEARSGLGRTSFLFGDIARGHYSAEQLAMSEQPIASVDPIFHKMAHETMETGQNIVSRLTKPPPGVSKKRFYGVTTPRRAAGAALAVTGNPIAFAAFMPEMAKVGRRVGGTIEDLVRLAPFQKYAKDPQIAAVLRDYGPINSSLDIKYKGFSPEIQQTMYDIGANVSRQFQFDYSNITPFERYVAKSIFPFWVYYKNNLALQIQQIAKQPRLFGAALKTMNYIDENGANYDTEPWNAILPAYFENLQAFQVPVPNQVRGALGLPKDQPLYLNPKLPFVAINMVPNFYEILKDPNMASTAKLREIAAPVFGSWGPMSPLPFPGGKIMLEAGTGYNLGLNRPIDYQRLESGDIRHGFTEAPSWISMLPDELTKHFGVTHYKGKDYISFTSAYLLDQMATPFVNNLGKSIPIEGADEDEKGKARANLISWLSGVRLMPVDILRLNRNAAYDTLNHMEAKQSEGRFFGQGLSPDEQAELKILRLNIKIIEDAWDRREGEGIYGEP